MPSNYTGNSNAGAQTPSPAPGPGTTPIGSLPVDADALNSASIYQLHKAELDYLTHLNGVAKFRPPRAPSGLTGFTSVTHTGGGGGTITPTAISTTQSQPSYTPYNFLFKIILGGAVGTATFQASLDGGNSFGGTTTSAATYTEPTSGVVVTFSGTFVASDTYAFSATDTPLAGYVDSSGNNHGLVVDAFGYPMGRWSELREDWLAPTIFTPASQTAVIPTGYPKWLASTGATATIQTTGIGAGNSINGSFIQLQPGSTAASKATLGLASAILAPSSTTVLSVLEFEWGMSAVGSNLLTVYAGWLNAADVSAATNGMCLSWTSGGPLVYSFISGSSTIPFTPSASSAGPNMRVKMVYGGSASPLPGMRVLINGSLVYASNANIPTQTLMPAFGCIAASGATASMSLGPVHCCWNRWANPELL